MESIETSDKKTNAKGAWPHFTRFAYMEGMRMTCKYLIVACALFVQHVVGMTIDGTVWAGDHGRFPVTDAISNVKRALSSAGAGAAIYSSMEAHKIGVTNFWSGVVITKEGLTLNVQEFTTYMDGRVELNPAEESVVDSIRSEPQLPSIPVEEVIKIHSSMGHDVKLIDTVGWDASSTNVVWVIQAFQAGKSDGSCVDESVWRGRNKEKAEMGRR